MSNLNLISWLGGFVAGVAHHHPTPTTLYRLTTLGARLAALMEEIRLSEIWSHFLYHCVGFDIRIDPFKEGITCKKLLKKNIDYYLG